MSVAYVESSALTKLILDEAESPAFRRALGAAEGGRVTSELTIVEVFRATRRLLGDTGLGRARATFLRFEHVPVDRAVIESAATIDPIELRSLDAIHIATALALGPSSDVVFFSYDQRTIEAARLYGLTVSSPGA